MNTSAIKTSKLKQALQLDDYTLTQERPNSLLTWIFSGNCDSKVLKELHGDPIKVKKGHCYFFICKNDKTLIELQIRQYDLFFKK
jgi:hypothetical protein